MKKIIVTGNVGKDPEVRTDQAGAQFVTFSIGVSVGTKQNPKTDWVDISCGGKLVDVARNYVKKGSKLLIEGFPGVNAYMTKENKPAATIRVFAHNMEFLSKREDDTTSPHDQNDDAYQLPPEMHSQHATVSNTEHIPF